MNCPFCGSNLVKVSAICPGCKIQLPEQNLFPYYDAALARDKSLSKPENRSKLDAQVKVEAEARANLLQVAHEKARIEAVKQEEQRLRQINEDKERVAKAHKEAQLKRAVFLEKNKGKIKLYSVLAIVLVLSVIAVSIALMPKPPKPYDVNEGKVQPCIALGAAAKGVSELVSKTLEENQNGGLDSNEISGLSISAQKISSKLFDETIGQTQNYPEIEGVIVALVNELNAYGVALNNLKSEAEVVAKVTKPVFKLAKSGESACKAQGFSNLFNQASGWEK